MIKTRILAIPWATKLFYQPQPDCAKRDSILLFVQSSSLYSAVVKEARNAIASKWSVALEMAPDEGNQTKLIERIDAGIRL